MKECPKCHAFCNDNEHFCAVCGTSLPASGSSSNQDSQQSGGIFGDYVPPVAKTKAEYMASSQGEGWYKACRNSAIVCYISAVLTLVLVCMCNGYWISMIDVLLVAGMGIGIHAAQSRVCAIILLVYSLVNTGIQLCTSGQFGGWLLIVAGIFAVISTFGAASDWKKYQQNPQPLIPQPNDPQATGAQYQPAPNGQQYQPVSNVQTPSQEREPSANEWRCPKCGSINQNYVGTCGCGCTKAEAKNPVAQDAVPQNVPPQNEDEQSDS